MPLAAPVTRTVRSLDRAAELFEIGHDARWIDRVAGLTRLAPIRRQVKLQGRGRNAGDERTGFQRQAGSGGRRLQRHRQRHRAGVPRQGRARCMSAAPAPAPPIIRQTKDRISRASTMRSSTSAIRRRSRISSPPFERLDVLVLAQGAVIYRRGEFEMDGFRKVLEVNLMSLMACATKFHAMLQCRQRLADHRQFDRGLSFDQGQSRLQCFQDRRGRADAHARARPGPRTASASTASRRAWSIPR